MIRRAAVLLPLAFLAGCPSGAPPGGPQAAGPPLPPAVLDDPAWVVLVRPAELLAAPSVRAILAGLGIAGDTDRLVADAGVDLDRLGWLRVEGDAARTLAVVPAAAADGLRGALERRRFLPAAPDGAAAATFAVDAAGAWAIVRSAGPPSAAGLAPRDDDPRAERLARLSRRAAGAPLLFLVRGPFAVAPELDPDGLLARTAMLGCAVAPDAPQTLRVGCVLFGAPGDAPGTAALQALLTRVFGSTLGLILDLEGAAESRTVDPEPGAAYVEAVLRVAALVPGLRVLAAVPLAHVLGGADGN